MKGTNVQSRTWDEIRVDVQHGSNMTGTDLCVNKPHYAAVVRTWESEATNSTLPPARLEPVQSSLGVARVMSIYGYKKKSVPVIFGPPCIFTLSLGFRGGVFRRGLPIKILYSSCSLPCVPHEPLISFILCPQQYLLKSTNHKSAPYTSVYLNVLWYSNVLANVP